MGPHVLECRQDTGYLAGLLNRIFMERVALASSSLDVLNPQKLQGTMAAQAIGPHFLPSEYTLSLHPDSEF